MVEKEELRSENGYPAKYTLNLKKPYQKVFYSLIFQLFSDVVQQAIHTKYIAKY